MKMLSENSFGRTTSASGRLVWRDDDAVRQARRRLAVMPVRTNEFELFLLRRRADELPEGAMRSECLKAIVQLTLVQMRTAEIGCLKMLATGLEVAA